MCKAKSDGGERCEYADQLANVRRNIRYKYRDDSIYTVQSEIRKAVTKWKDDHPDIVKEHLPERLPFQAKANRRYVPDEYLNMLSSHSRDVIKGLPEDERKQLTERLHLERNLWEENLSEDESNLVRMYSQNYYELVNNYLRRTNLHGLLKENAFYKEKIKNGKVKNDIAILDSALAQASSKEARKLYRFYRIPDGLTPTEFMDRFIHEGESFKEAGYMSTTADPEFLLAHLHKQNGGTRNQKYVIMEIVTKEGASLQPHAHTNSGDIQSLEHEVLLPRNTKLRIVGARKSQRFEFAADRKDLNDRYGQLFYDKNSYERWGLFKQGDRMSFPIIQMVDEKLI